MERCCAQEYTEFVRTATRVGNNLALARLKQATMGIDGKLLAVREVSSSVWCVQRFESGCLQACETVLRLDERNIKALTTLGRSWAEGKTIDSFTKVLHLMLL